MLLDDAEAMHIAGLRPRYMVDLLVGEDPAGVFEPSEVHGELDRFIENYQDGYGQSG